MRTTIRNAVLAASAILLCASGTARASTTSMLRADVPFPFVVNGKSFPAGKYTIQRDDTSPTLLLIRGVGNNHSSTFMSTNPDGGRDPAGYKPALEFKRHENQYRLASVWESQNQGWDVVGR